ncbi:MAG: phage integrase N-terminal SAM-like domain-containing protein [Prolixibacteraceae bacterium]|nr:phage integrase N-terminal SAM-like domain-containing protein [Prolixibacteraceae bacterium]
MGRNVKVILQPVKFRKQSHVAILCPDHSEVDEILRELNEVEWSTGYRFWHLPYTESSIGELTDALKGVAVIDSSAFRHFKSEKRVEKPHRKTIKRNKPTAEQLAKLKKFEAASLERGYSAGTVKVYLSLLNVFFGFFNQKTDQEITMDDIQLFLIEYIDKNNLTINYRRLMTNSLRRYFDFIERPELSKI